MYHYLFRQLYHHQDQMALLKRLPMILDHPTLNIISFVDSWLWLSSCWFLLSTSWAKELRTSNKTERSSVCKLHMLRDTMRLLHHDVIKVIVVEIYCVMVKRLMKITRIKFADGISLAKLLNGPVVCYKLLKKRDLKSSSFDDFTERPTTSTAPLQEYCFIRHWDLN